MIYTLSRMYTKSIILLAIVINCVNAYHLTYPVDLTWSFENSTIYWPGEKEFKLTKVIAGLTKGNYWLAMNQFCAAEHGGTHIDAPYHFAKDGRKVGAIPIERLIAAGAVIDISYEVDLGGSSVNLEVRHLEEWQRIFGPFEDNTVLIVKFGWSKYYPDKQAFLGTDESNGLHFPGVSKEAAEWILHTGKVVGVAVDVASVDPGTVTTADSHRVLLGNDIYVVENAKMIVDLPPRDFTLLVMPMNIAEGSGAPVRLVAVPRPITYYK